LPIHEYIRSGEFGLLRSNSFAFLKEEGFSFAGKSAIMPRSLPDAGGHGMKVLIIDDDAAFLTLLKEYAQERFPGLELTTCNDPIKGLAAITDSLDLLLVDLEMPGIDGAKVLAYATDIGLSKNRIIILSGRDADYLHRRFPMGSCLAVLNKFEAKQKAVLEMIFNSLHKKCEEK
jgi:CheY-like chemotaxis protein